MLHKSDQFIVASKFAEILVFRANDFQVFAATDFKFWRAKQKSLLVQRITFAGTSNEFNSSKK